MGNTCRSSFRQRAPATSGEKGRLFVPSSVHKKFVDTNVDNAAKKVDTATGTDRVLYMPWTPLVEAAIVAMLEGVHIRLKGWQQAAVAVGSALGALMDPRRADLIAALGETTAKPAFQRVLGRMRSVESRAVLLEQPRVISSKVSHACDLPEGTFGAAYAKFMGSRNFSLDDRPPVRFMDTENLAYVAIRAREVHDFWHVLFDLPTNLIGESALKVIEFEQMLLPMCFSSVISGTSRFSEKQQNSFFQHYLPWAARAGMQSTDLMCIYYERYFAENLEEVCKRWGIAPAPSPRSIKH